MLVGLQYLLLVHNCFNGIETNHELQVGIPGERCETKIYQTYRIIYIYIYIYI